MTLGQVAYEANKEAWPPAESYVPWDNLTAQARNGWELVAERVRAASIREVSQ